MSILDAERLTVLVYTDGNTGDRTLTVERWPRHVAIDEMFLQSAAASYVTQDGNTVTLTVANGQATYELGAWDIYSMSREAWLVSSRLSAWHREAAPDHSGAASLYGCASGR